MCFVHRTVMETDSPPAVSGQSERVVPPHMGRCENILRMVQGSPWLSTCLICLFHWCVAYADVVDCIISWQWSGGSHHEAGDLLMCGFLLQDNGTSWTIEYYCIHGWNKLTLYKLCIRSILTYAAPVWSSASVSNYRRLQVLQSKCLRVIGNLPRRTPIHQLHTIRSILPIREHIHTMTARFFHNSSYHPLIHDIGNYSLYDFHQQYTKYVHKRTKHILL